MPAAGSNPAPSANDSGPPPARADFHLARARPVAALGRVAPVVGVAVLVVVLLSALTEGGTVATAALAVAWLVTGVGFLLTAVAAVRTVRPPVLVRLDATGLEVRVLRGGGPRQVPWADVRAVRRERLAPGRCVVVERRDGQRTVLPERLVAEGGAALAATLSARLDQAHGQRRLRPDGEGGGGGI